MATSTTRQASGAASGNLTPQRPTQKDIALAAGVSQATVSLVLNKSETPSVPATTRIRILKAANELGYQPNHAARILRSARTMTLACVIPDITNPFYPGLVRGLQSAATPAGYDVLIFDTDGTPDGESRAINWLLQGRADGVVATFFHLRAPELAVLSRKGIPLVRLEGVHRPDGPLPIDSVYIDNIEASAAMTRMLIARGHRHIAMIETGFGPSARRVLGYSSVMQEAALRPDVVTESAFSIEAGARAMQHLLNRGRDRPTAVFGASDVLAIGAMQEARKAGLSIPGDIAIAGFDDIPGAALLGLTTVRQPELDLGALAARTLIQRLRPGGLDLPGHSYELKFEIMRRASV